MMKSELTRCIHAVLFVLTKFLVVHERERSEGLSDEGGSLSRNMSIVYQPLHPDTGPALSEERVVAVQRKRICTLSPTCDMSQMK